MVSSIEINGRIFVRGIVDDGNGLIYSYDAECDKWQKKTSVGKAAYVALAKLGNQMYAMEESTLYLYDFEQDTWQKVCPSPFGQKHNSHSHAY